jgi:hypothetical protein
MKFARIVFRVAAVYGFLVLVPLYFLMERMGQDAPPPITHAEFYYGFVGLALVWQAVFWLIASDPLRYRPIMPVAILEKVAYALPALILYAQGRLAPSMLWTAMADAVLGVFFAAAWIRTGGEARAKRQSAV